MTRVFVCEYKDLKRQSQAGSTLLDFVLREYYALDLSRLTVRRGERGKPFFEGNPVHYNLSHSSGALALAVSDHPVGVDVEAERKVGRHIGERYLGISTDDPTELLRAWTRRESYGKMTGEGFFCNQPQCPHFFAEYRYSPNSFDFMVTVCSPIDDFERALTVVTLG